VSLLTIFSLEDVDKLFRTKMEYGQLFLFKKEKNVCVNRPLTVLESETVSSFNGKISDVAVEDWIFYTSFVCGTSSKDFFLTKYKAGFVKHCAINIYKLSNIQDPKQYNEALTEYRNSVNSVQNLLEVIVTKAYSYSHKDLKNMTQYKQLEILAKAEKITSDTLQLQDSKKANKAALRRFTEGASVVGAEDITSPEVADKPDF